MKFLTIFNASKLLNITRQHLLLKCKKGYFKLYKCNCEKSYLLDENEVKKSGFKKRETKKG